MSRDRAVRDGFACVLGDEALLVWSFWVDDEDICQNIGNFEIKTGKEAEGSCGLAGGRETEVVAQKVVEPLRGEKS